MNKVPITEDKNKRKITIWTILDSNVFVYTAATVTFIVGGLTLVLMGWYYLNEMIKNWETILMIIGGVAVTILWYFLFGKLIVFIVSFVERMKNRF